MPLGGTWSFPLVGAPQCTQLDLFRLTRARRSSDFIAAEPCALLFVNAFFFFNPQRVSTN